MAEGLISSEHHQSQTMMQMAESYLNDLHQRSLVFVREEEVTTARGRFHSCSLHDLMYEFCCFMGRREELFVVMKKGQEQDSDSSSWSDRTWRLVMYVGEHYNNKSLDRLNKKLRCLRVCYARENQGQYTHEMSDLIDCIMQWRCLRTLDFDGIYENMTLLKGIADLVHLRYLRFTGCWLEALPKSIGDLPFLQILDLRVEVWCPMEIANVLHKMKRLRHLYLPLTFPVTGGVKLRLDGLTRLETLENFNTRECDVEDLFKLTKLRYTTMIVEGSLEDFKICLEDLERLIVLMNMNSETVLHSSLDVRNFDCYTEERHSVFRQLLACRSLQVLYMKGHLGQIPPYQKVSGNITWIVLSGSGLQIDPMPTLEMLPNLRKLILNDLLEIKLSVLHQSFQNSDI